MPKIKKCEFDKQGTCHALACFSSRKCGARDERGEPIYAKRNWPHDKKGEQVDA